MKKYITFIKNKNGIKEKNTYMLCYSAKIVQKFLYEFDTACTIWK